MADPKRQQRMAASDLRRIAVAAECDTKVVASEVAAPGKINNVVRDRVRRAMRELKLGPFREPA